MYSCWMQDIEVLFECLLTETAYHYNTNFEVFYLLFLWKCGTLCVLFMYSFRMYIVWFCSIII